MEKLIFLEILCVHMKLGLLLNLFAAVVVVPTSVEIYQWKIYLTKSLVFDNTY